MKVKEVLALAAENLGREELAAAVYDCAGNPSGELFSLLRCYNLVENEIALDYFPLKRRETLSAPDGEIAYQDFAFAPVEILEVRGEGGAPVAFEARPAGLKLPRGAGRAEVLYTYSPAEKQWTDDCEFSGKISVRLLSFGVASEFCLACGRYAEAAVWEKKFRDALRAANVLRRKLMVRSRRWV